VSREGYFVGTDILCTDDDDADGGVQRELLYTDPHLVG
jgi:hypothetical protein